MIDGLVASLGGYESGLFYGLLIGCFLVGSVLIKVFPLGGIPFLIFGIVVMLGLIGYHIAQVPNPPWYVKALPLLFSVASIIGVFRAVLACGGGKEE